MKTLEFHTPIFTQNTSVEAFFTLKNSHIHPNTTIPGLNLGLNTNVTKEEIRNNQHVLFSHFNLKRENLALSPQVHGNKVHIVEKGGIHPEGDGFVTSTPNVGLAVLVADCAGVLLADTSNKVVAAIHAGWRGALAGIVPEAIRKMGMLGAKESSVQAFISPCLSVDAFEVGEEVAEKFPSKYVDRNYPHKPHVHLKSFIRQQLIDAGLSAEAIETHSGCTKNNGKDYYSYRREGNKSGRMMAFIRIK